ncbi:NUDIX domain-containing protein [Breoghania corrubedonensis]|uniref:NUDIX domain-containing protein n=1 Tax=Breoghania corrubedonensis TaxID=665038 RepID=A0A2T5VCJ6_9HYPH|nr:NUDIX domain-containing protein [Breoghania corrubedonensis]PTW61468.1 NUDIX domain-containing protein [Breoghania corrubedonensis]
MTNLVERLSTAERRMDYENVRPRDAATLLILDRTAGGEPQVLMGRRHTRHKFMPGKFVFPGGRVDPTDSRVPLAGDYEEPVKSKLMQAMKHRKGEARARAFAVAAIRETYEEAGVFIGRKDGAGWRAPDDFAAFAERGISLDLSPMRFVARAITPPRRPRRFDTRFLAVWADAICDRLPEGTGPTGELEELCWLSLEEAKSLELPTITLTIIEELQKRLADDPELDPSTPVPYYHWQRKGFVREEV